MATRKRANCSGCDPTRFRKSAGSSTFLTRRVARACRSSLIAGAFQKSAISARQNRNLLSLGQQSLRKIQNHRRLPRSANSQISNADHHAIQPLPAEKFPRDKADRTHARHNP